MKRRTQSRWLFALPVLAVAGISAVALAQQAPASPSAAPPGAPAATPPAPPPDGPPGPRPPGPPRGERMGERGGERMGGPRGWGGPMAGPMMAGPMGAPPGPMGGPMGPMMRHRGGPFAGLIFHRGDRHLTPPEVQRIVEGFLLWNGERSWRVVDVKEAEENTVEFGLAPAEGGAFARFRMDRATGRIHRVG
ncbi:hypothetical protein M0638_24075 [Roseomonas sp. NAR14]|uniref:PepSY domain-containing protein n=1 Tax=Roseomonas acroporae TaxID=2937791 RepID=A0A9X2BW87_9PROT|nr:hypothetical protein [Roseomonas acroporae]MCK8787452.1 hypothetical protein [Roseomonas acroporae]